MIDGCPEAPWAPSPVAAVVHDELPELFDVRELFDDGHDRKAQLAARAQPAETEDQFAAIDVTLAQEEVVHVRTAERRNLDRLNVRAMLQDGFLQHLERETTFVVHVICAKPLRKANLPWIKGNDDRPADLIQLLKALQLYPRECEIVQERGNGIRSLAFLPERLFTRRQGNVKPLC